MIPTGKCDLKLSFDSGKHQTAVVSDMLLLGLNDTENVHLTILCHMHVKPHPCESSKNLVLIPFSMRAYY